MENENPVYFVTLKLSALSTPVRFSLIMLGLKIIQSLYPLMSHIKYL